MESPREGDAVESASPETGRPQVSVAHYGEQNGDLMRDPDLVCEVYPDGRWVPVSFGENTQIKGIFQANTALSS